MGIEIIKAQLIEMGYEPFEKSNDGISYPPGFIGFKFIIPLGKFRGQEVEVALEAPQFPLIPPSGPHIKPHILPITGGGGTHPFGGIHHRRLPTANFQYWSRPFNDWVDSDKNMKTYLAFLRTLFDFE